MRYRLGLRTALRALGAHKIRSGLTLLGIVVGVAAVVAMVAIGQGTRAQVMQTVESMGTNLLTVSAAQLKFTAGRQQQAGSLAVTLTEKDARAISEEIGAVSAVAPAQSKRLSVKIEDQTTTTTVVGTNAEFQTVRNFRPVSGGFFDEEQERSSARVAVLGQTALLNLFGSRDPLGETIRIGNVPFQVIGVLEAKGLDISGQDQDDQILIPLRTALRRVFNLTSLNTIYVSARDTQSMESAAIAITDLLRERHRLHSGTTDDFTIQNQSTLLATQSAVSGTFTLLLGSIGSISLLVGGIGILAIMLIAVRERTREIGLRRAVGARRKDILLQFLIETALLSVLGGIGGVLTGIIGATVVAAVTNWPMLIPWPTAIGAVAFSLILGLVFGVHPARKAAALDPIVALRTD
jgi:putative ABC transport system permease protein